MCVCGFSIGVPAEPPAQRLAGWDKRPVQRRAPVGGAAYPHRSQTQTARGQETGKSSHTQSHHSERSCQRCRLICVQNSMLEDLKQFIKQRFQQHIAARGFSVFFLCKLVTLPKIHVLHKSVAVLACIMPQHPSPPPNNNKKLHLLQVTYYSCP